jgi:PAS domain S-box-containing protein
MSILVVNGAGAIVFANVLAQQLFGYSPEELLQCSVDDLVPLRFRDAHPGLRLAFSLAPVARPMGTGRALFGLRRDGSEFPLEVGLSPVDTDAGRLFVSAIIDISEREQTKRLKEAVEALERSNQELQRFAYVASHDLQTPMRSIASFVQLLGSTYGDRLDDRGRDWIHRTVASVKHLQAMVRDLLEYSRIGSDHLNFESLAVRDVVDDVILLLDASIREAGAQVVVGDLPRVLGDRSQLLQLFHNLIGNALKYRGTEPTRIDVSAAREGADWQFAVRDNGIGIDPRHFERIFEMFQRLHDQSHYAGTGIGLAVCRRIVNGHGGRIWVDSPPGGGSIFRFSLPALSKEPS